MIKKVSALGLAGIISCTCGTASRQLGDSGPDTRGDTVVDASFIEDAAPDVAIPSDADLDRLVDATTEDSRVPDCYYNWFASEDDLRGFVQQSGVWERHPDGYLQQIGIGDGVAYMDTAQYADIDAKLRVRLVEGPFGRPQYAGLIFRYTRRSAIGFDKTIDKGYILKLENGDGSSFDLALEDLNVGNIRSQRVEGRYGEWLLLGVNAVGNHVTISYEGRMVFELDTDLYASGLVGFGTHVGSADFDDLSICRMR